MIGSVGDLLPLAGVSQVTRVATPTNVATLASHPATCASVHDGATIELLLQVLSTWQQYASDMGRW